MAKESLKRNPATLERLGCLTAENLDLLRRGQTPTIAGGRTQAGRQRLITAMQNSS